MFAPYRRVFRTPGFTLPYLFGILVTLALGSVGLGLLLAVQAGMLVALFVLMFVGSTLVAVTPIASSALLDDVAPPHALTTAYTATVGCGLVAASCGNAVAGTIAQDHGPAAAFALAAAAMTAAAARVGARRGSLGVPG